MQSIASAKLPQSLVRCKVASERMLSTFRLCFATMASYTFRHLSYMKQMYCGTRPWKLYLRWASGLPNFKMKNVSPWNGSFMVLSESTRHGYEESVLWALDENILMELDWELVVSCCEVSWLLPWLRNQLLKRTFSLAVTSWGMC